MKRCHVFLAALVIHAHAFAPAQGVNVDRFVALKDTPWQRQPASAKLRSENNLLVVQRSDLAIRVDVCRPDDARQLPGLLMIHGGGWTGGNKEAFRPIARALAARGWVVVSTSYRLATQAPFPAAVHDVKAAVRWMRAHATEWGIDPARIGAVGGSAGGHLAGMIATTADRLLEEPEGPWKEHSCALQAAVLMDAGVDQLSRALESPKPIPSQLIFFGGPVTEKRELYIQGSPLHQITAACPPLLFLDGENDNPGQRYVSIRQRMDALGVPHQLTVVEGCAHGAWGKAPWLPHFVAEMDRFLSQYLKKT
jgi:acetyl esterase/lipase